MVHVSGILNQLMDIIMMYTDIDFKYHSHLSTTINNQLSLHMLEEDIGTEEPIHNIIYMYS